MTISMKVIIFAIMKTAIVNGVVPTKYMMAHHLMGEKREFGTVGKRMAKRSGVSSHTKKVVPAQNLMNTRSVNVLDVVKVGVPLGEIIAYGVTNDLPNMDIL